MFGRIRVPFDFEAVYWSPILVHVVRVSIHVDFFEKSFLSSAATHLVVRCTTVHMDVVVVVVVVVVVGGGGGIVFVVFVILWL